MGERLAALLRVTVRVVICFAAALGAGRVCCAGADVIIYDVEFDGPPHVVGLTPTFGAGPYPRHTPTSGGQILSPTGTATVVPAFGLLGTRPVQLTALDGTPNDPILGGTDLIFDLSDFEFSPLKRFHASVDVVFGDVTTSTGLGVFFDTPGIHKVEFSPDGKIRVRDTMGLDQVVGDHVVETVYHVSMTWDKGTSQWSAAINGNPVYLGPVDDPDLLQFRIAMTTGSTTVTSVGVVDNIRIVADAVPVPEPCTLMLTTMIVGA